MKSVLGSIVGQSLNLTTKIHLTATHLSTTNNPQTGEIFSFFLMSTANKPWWACICSISSNPQHEAWQRCLFLHLKQNFPTNSSWQNPWEHPHTKCFHLISPSLTKPHPKMKKADYPPCTLLRGTKQKAYSTDSRKNIFFLIQNPASPDPLPRIYQTVQFAGHSIHIPLH